MNSSVTASRRETFLAVLLVVFTTLITYGVLIPKLGFYHDDWYLLWAAKSEGAKGILSLFQGDRPFIGWVYIFDFSVIGLSPLAWHLYALCIKLASALVFLWLARSLWPSQRVVTLFVTLLFVVYPGFFQQPNALTYKQLLISYTAALLSLALTVNAVKTNKTAIRVVFTILAMLLGAFYLLIYEALVGMEVVRFVLLWYLFQQKEKDWKKNLRSVLVSAVPYLIFAMLFVFWRLFLFDSTRKATSVEGLMGSFISFYGLVGLLLELIKDLVETPILAWAVPYYQFSSQADYRDLITALALGLLVVLAGGYYFLAQKQAKDQDGSEESSRDLLILGSIVVFLTTLPIVVAGRNASFGGSGWDRYTYQSVLGVALFMGGMIFYVFKGRMRWVLLGGLLISGVLTQYISAGYFRDYWKVEREAWWQLSWRAPQIKDGTTLVVSLPGGFGLVEEYEVWGPANLIYQPSGALRLPGQVMFDQLWFDLLLRTQEERLVRDTFTIPRDYGKVIIASQSYPNACLHVLDGRRSDQAVMEARTDVRNVAKYSNVEFIQPSDSPAIPPPSIFGSEPPHNWCYYYQKMDLARQMNDWQAVAELTRKARANNLEPVDVTEWMPALEAYVQLNDMERAKQIARLVRDEKYTFSRMCAQYESLKGQPAGYDRDTIYEVLCKK